MGLRREEVCDSLAGGSLTPPRQRSGAWETPQPHLELTPNTTNPTPHPTAGQAEEREDRRMEVRAKAKGQDSDDGIGCGRNVDRRGVRLVGGVAQPPMNASQPIRAGKKELAMHKKVSKKKLVWVMSIGRNRL